ncbi:MAG: PhoH family protein [Chitinophagales bacterium]
MTRIGPSAKCIITGDLTQIDLPRNQTSGLYTSIRILKDIDGIGTIFLNENDVVRHKLVKQIIKAYDRERSKREQAAEERKKDNEAGAH